MAETPKRIKRLLREYAAAAHEEELRRALLPISEAFGRWKRRELDSGELSEIIHLNATSQADASRIRQRIEGKGVSIQTWAIVPKIMEVDGLLRADEARHEIVREVHPEVSFFFLNGERPMSTPKRKADGQAERLSVLRKWGGEATVEALARQKELACKTDDILDALVALWTEERIACGTAISIPAKPPFDVHGLRMEMLA